MIGSQIIELQQVDSTNSYATALYETLDFKDGTVIRAHEQFAGRGQGDRRWDSEAGKNLTFTVCLKPTFLEPQRQFLLNKAITLGILDFLQSAMGSQQSAVGSQQAHIKWPNDIYLGDRKMGGILIENRIMGSVFAASFAGIGLNINQTRFAPDVPNPVSLIHVLRHEIVLRDALERLCGLLDTRYEALRRSDRTETDREFESNLLGFDQQRSFLCKGETFEGRIKGVDDSGRLKVELADGTTEFFAHGEIELVIC